MINWDEFNLYLGLFDRDFVVVEIVGGFLSGSREQMSDLKKNVEEKDFPLVHRNAHTLKTLCATFGDKAATELAFKLEMMGKEHSDDDMNCVYHDLAKAVDNLILELEQYKNMPPR